MTTIKTPGRVALMAAASVLALSTAVGADTIRFWTTEEQPERLANGRRPWPPTSPPRPASRSR
jgi:hypothetical protein